MNVPEQEGENCANIIYDIIENELNMDVENLQFHAIHRVGKRRSSDETSKAYPRPIIARFLCREDRDLVLKAKGRLRNSSQYENVYITQDYAKRERKEKSFNQGYVSGSSERYECKGSRQKLGGKYQCL